MDTGIVAALTNFGALGVVLLLVLIGWLVPRPYFAKLEEENKHLREALRLEMQRGNDAEQAGRVTTQLIGALTNLATERTGHRRRPAAKPPPSDTGLDLEDIS